MRRAKTQRVKMMTRTSSTINKKWSRSMMMSCTVTGVEQRGEVANGQSEGLSIILLQYIYTFHE